MFAVLFVLRRDVATLFSPRGLIKESGACRQLAQFSARSLADYFSRCAGPFSRSGRAARWKRVAEKRRKRFNEMWVENREGERERGRHFARANGVDRVHRGFAISSRLFYDFSFYALFNRHFARRAGRCDFIVSPIKSSVAEIHKLLCKNESPDPLLFSLSLSSFSLFILLFFIFFFFFIRRFRQGSLSRRLNL